VAANIRSFKSSPLPKQHVTGKWLETFVLTATKERELRARGSPWRVHHTPQKRGSKYVVCYSECRTGIICYQKDGVAVEATNNSIHKKQEHVVMGIHGWDAASRSITKAASSPSNLPPHVTVFFFPVFCCFSWECLVTGMPLSKDRRVAAHHLSFSTVSSLFPSSLLFFTVMPPSSPSLPFSPHCCCTANTAATAIFFFFSTALFFYCRRFASSSVVSASPPFFSE
jgi:hypothetical protein